MDDGGMQGWPVRWVVGLGRCYGALSVLRAAFSIPGALLGSSPRILVLTLLLTGWASAWIAVVRAFADHRRGARQLMLALVVVHLTWSALGVATGRPGSELDPGRLLVGIGYLGLLLHRNSRDWVGAAGPVQARHWDTIRS